ncbi:molybdenum cofactor guanylyltransferase [Sphingobacterium alkalisoli]|uniref:Molybdenum cofactor guanylyltransferase n=1 Tax=Sphingobacterium alkalisoli TaxID=1874115 RepID=A0A4U0GXL0_9SPHI|nr:molybdenum cofactor guanylyltransferase [Sphingobacterium alkalisoli]TJY63920.1 molybdenum cofactor guanylyltransferase [Sphingobacterium alkalisoli]GGH24050.1 hypothetical protein GCM10011418_31670 [Sphingobacterium alkalisoli]
MVGLVLCGGESKRMGTDKGMLRSGNLTWAQVAQKTLKDLDLPVFISVNEIQVPSYQRQFSRQHLIVDHVPVKGPLAGLLSFHYSYPETDVLVLPCDMVNMDTNTLYSLIKSYDRNRKMEGHFFLENNFIEPLCAVYSCKMLAMIAEQIVSGQLTHFALHKIISRFHISVVPIPDRSKFANYNSIDSICN